ncbi:interferon a3-like [Symphorus nematophorus]
MVVSRVFDAVIASISLCTRRLYSAASSLTCSWMDHKFTQHSVESLDILDTMASYEDAEVEDIVAFPNELYNQASTASAEDKLCFTVQILEETAALFEEDHSLASWEENIGDNFVNVVFQQADGLRSCIWSHKKSKKLHMYFKRLSRHILKKMGHSAAAWELIRRQIRTHLMRADQLVSPLLTTN